MASTVVWVAVDRLRCRQRDCQMRVLAIDYGGVLSRGSLWR